jgi:hypothetical protein
MDVGRVALGTETDRCSEAILLVQTNGQPAEVRKGQVQEIRVPDSRFWWNCGDIREWTTAPPGTNFVIVQRAPEGREITWHCFRDVQEGLSGGRVLLTAVPYPQSRVHRLPSGRVQVEIRTFDRNYVLYAEAGCTVTVEGGVADSVRIENRFFTAGGGDPFLIGARDREFGVTTKATNKESAGGFGVSLELYPDFGVGGGSPETIEGLLPVDGIVSHVWVQVADTLIESITAVGEFPQ